MSTTSLRPKNPRISNTPSRSCSEKPAFSSRSSHPFPSDKGAKHWIFSLDSERALDLPIYVHFNLYHSFLDGKKMSSYSLLALCGSLKSLVFSALMGLSSLSWCSAPPWWSECENPIDLFLNNPGTKGDFVSSLCRPIVSTFLFYQRLKFKGFILL